jgi:hypothetical protein
MEIIRPQIDAAHVFDLLEGQSGSHARQDGELSRRSLADPLTNANRRTG